MAFPIDPVTARKNAQLQSAQAAVKSAAPAPKPPMGADPNAAPGMGQEQKFACPSCGAKLSVETAQEDQAEDQGQPGGSSSPAGSPGQSMGY